jgi:hypothetical protein
MRNDLDQPSWRKDIPGVLSVGVFSVYIVRKVPRMGTLHRVGTRRVPRQKMHHCPTHKRKSAAYEDYVSSAVHNDLPLR